MELNYINTLSKYIPRTLLITLLPDISVNTSSPYNTYIPVYF